MNREQEEIVQLVYEDLKTKSLRFVSVHNSGQFHTEYIDQEKGKIE